MKHNLVAAFLVAALIPNLAMATLIVVEPDDFADGADISDAVAGVTLSLEGRPGERVYSRDATMTAGPTAGSNNAPTGNKVFGHKVDTGFPDITILWTTTVWPSLVLRADFDSLADFVSIDAFANDDDTFQLEAYTADGILLDVFNTGVIEGTTTTLSISRMGFDIAYILAYGVAPEGSGNLDNLRVNVASVPEPSTLLLMATGLAGLGLTRKRWLKVRRIVSRTSA